MLVEEDPQEPSPDQALETGLPRSPDRVSDRERDPEREDDPEHVHAVDRPDEAILVQVFAVLPSALHPLEREEPADVGVEEAVDRAEHAVPMPDMW